MTMLFGLTTTLLPGSPKPTALRSAFSPMARNTPAATPIALAIKPTVNDSPITDASTCRRLAPIARSKAISRSRCATTMEKVL